ncbi:hypothetical protein Pla86_07410 [Planctomycetes bacterium Pla86]|uniref:Uncharacterized protein n=1 Tax=Engelhardtia mirabilis TaxID=2528011 RepID=A0A518BFB5_9BACT|nr:hypothetical protein Pla133_07420 [Planctomycetes bacterium Pla133]QDV00003.1 hypothetical protein Pla86_07410 [Planctomycetes bacterium Pla86]
MRRAAPPRGRPGRECRRLRGHRSQSREQLRPPAAPPAQPRIVRPPATRRRPRPSRSTLRPRSHAVFAWGVRRRRSALRPARRPTPAVGGGADAPKSQARARCDRRAALDQCTRMPWGVPANHSQSRGSPLAVDRRASPRGRILSASAGTSRAADVGPNSSERLPIGWLCRPLRSRIRPSSLHRARSSPDAPPPPAAGRHGPGGDVVRIGAGDRLGVGHPRPPRACRSGRGAGRAGASVQSRGFDARDRSLAVGAEGASSRVFERLSGRSRPALR